MKHSAIYEGAVSHERREPKHSFRNRLFLMYLDLDELPHLFDGRLLWSVERPNAVCFRRADYMGPTERPLKEAVLWRERHAYVLDARACEGGELRWRFDKDFHVSPFHDMDHEYSWSFGVPGDELKVHMTNVQDGRAVFHAGLSCRRRELTGRSLASALMRHPWLTLRVHLAIYLQAALLWLKRAPFHPHPDKRAKLARTTT
jgi:DUF1365 family protein